MKALILALSLLSISAFAQGRKLPNQTCNGLNQFNDIIITRLWISPPIMNGDFDAKLEITLKSNRPDFKGEMTKGIYGKLTKQADPSGARMFSTPDDSLRFVTSGFLYDLTSYELRGNLNCSKVIF